MSTIVVIAIGRNEGDRLRACLTSALASPKVAAVIYVDSGSTDNSLAFAASLGADAIALDMSVPFTAARARNIGLGRAVMLEPVPDYLQFVDGDCELHPDWLPAAAAFLDAKPRVAVAC